MPSQGDTAARIDELLADTIAAVETDRTNLVLTWRDLVNQRDSLNLKIAALEAVIRTKDQRRKTGTGDVR